MIWHSSTVDETILELETDTKTGLSSCEVESRLIKYGKNEIHNPDIKSFSECLLKKFKNIYLISLMVVSAVYFILSTALNLNNKFEGIAVILFTIISIILFATIEYFSNKQFDKMKNRISTNSTVIRDGVEMIVSSNTLVPGDIIVLKSGDYIPVDARLVDSYALVCEEFLISGDKAPSEKFHDNVYEDITPLSNRHNMVYSGSHVLNGRGIAVVTETSLNTQIGMRKDMQQQLDNTETPLAIKIEKVRKVLSNISLTLIVLIFFSAIIANFTATDVSFAVTVTGSLLLSLSLCFLVFSELIPSLISLARVSASVNLFKKGVRISNTKSLEALRDTTVICTDKTGAITTEELSVVKLYNGNQSIELSSDSIDESSVTLLRLALVCSNFDTDEHGERHTNRIESAIEDACIKYTRMSKTDIDGIFPKIAELPFDSERMLMTTVTAINGNPMAVVKGAPEIITTRCTDINKDKINSVWQSYAKDGLKVLAVAVKPLPEIPANPNSDELEHGLTFVGIIAMEDKIDRRVSGLCRECFKSGVRVVMVTGDLFDTAVDTAIKAGIINDPSEAISGEKLSEIDDLQLIEDIQKYSVFARIRPEDKLRIVQALKAHGEKVLMTGDSTNDLQALLEADFGCALGKTASDIVKDSADIVVDDNRFSSIVLSLKESSRMFINIKKALTLLFTLQSALLVAVLFGFIIFGNPLLTSCGALLLTLLPIVVAISVIFSEKSACELLHSKHEFKLIDKSFMLRFSLPSLLIIILSLIAHGICLSQGEIISRTASFAVVIFGLLIDIICVAHTKTLLSKSILSQKALLSICGLVFICLIILLLTPVGQLFSLGILTSSGWILSLISVLSIFITNELLKRI